MKKTNFFIGAIITLMLMTMSFSVTVVAPNGTIHVYVDIRPDSCPNPIMVRSRGVLPIAICGTDEFDVINIDVDTILIEDVEPIRASIEDVATPFEGEECDCHEIGSDGILDLTLKFDIQEIIDALGDIDDREVITLTLTGQLIEEFGSTPIEGSDCILVIKK